MVRPTLDHDSTLGGPVPIVHLNPRPSLPALTDEPLDPETVNLLRSSVSSSTWRTYDRDLRTIERYCHEKGVRSIPATPSTVANYVGAMSRVHAAATIERRVATWSAWHKATGHDTDEANPCRSVLVRKALQGLRREAPRQREAQPFTMDDLRLVLDVVSPETLIGLRDRALLTVGLVLGRRRSELVALNVEDLRWSDTPPGYSVDIRRSKTDQEGEAPPCWLPRTTRTTCPVQALHAWLTAASITSGALFRSVDKFGRVGGRLSDRSVSSILARRAEEADLRPGQWSGHSLRAGFVTDAARDGVPIHEIARQTGHKPTSPVLYRYVRTVAPHQANAAAREGWA